MFFYFSTFLLFSFWSISGLLGGSSYSNVMNMLRFLDWLLLDLALFRSFLFGDGSLFWRSAGLFLLAVPSVGCRNLNLSLLRHPVVVAKKLQIGGVSSWNFFDLSIACRISF